MATYFIQNTNNVEDIEQMNKIVDKVSKVNTTAIGNIGQLTELNNKAEKLSEDIQQALPINKELKENIRIGQPLVQESTTKNTELQASLEKTKEFINGLDGSQNIPQIRLDVNELQNGLKSNQALAYTGSSISADNTLEGRTEGMKIEGKTMYKKADGTYTDTWEEGVTLESFGEKEGNKISILSNNYNLYDSEISKKLSGDNIIFNNDDSIEFYQNGNRLVIKENFKEKTQYTFSFYGLEGKCSFNVVYTDNTSDSISGLGIQSITSQIGKTISVIRSQWLDGLKSKLKDIQIVEGTENLPYLREKKDKKDILIKEPLREGDYLYEDNGQVKVYRDVKQYTFTGDENISIRGEVKENTMSFAYAVKNNKSNALLCNNFKVLGGWDKDEERIWLDGTNLMFHIQKSKLTTPDVNGFKAWLKANPTTIVYQLAEPTVEIVENCVDIDLDTFGEKTYFNILNSLPGTLDFKVPSNIASIVQSTAREVNNIWDVINNLLVPSLIDINKNVAMSTIKNNLK